MMEPNDAAIMVQVKINGQGPYDFVLDTGATFTCLDNDLADQLKLPRVEGATRHRCSRPRWRRDETLEG
jgi:predicted aspartyl protease